MTAEFIVEWHELMPFGDAEWQSALQQAVNLLRSDSPLRFRSPSDSSADLLMIAYMAGDHDTIVQGRKLATFLGKRADLHSTAVVLVACANRKPALSPAAVRELLMDQGAGLQGETFMRIKLPESLTKDCQSLLIQRLEKRQLMEPSPSSIDESAILRPQRLTPRRRFENI